MPQRNPLKKLVKDTQASIAQEFVERPLGARLARLWNGLVRALRDVHRIRDIVKNNYELGVKHYRLGNIDDAMLRLSFVTWLEPHHAQAWYWLGLSYLAAEKKRAAKKAFLRALAIKPDWPEAAHQLAIASGHVVEP